MRFGVVIKFCLVAIAAFLLIGAASAQQAPFFPVCVGQSTPCGFSSMATKFLQMNGSQLALWNDQKVLRLTNVAGSDQESATSWFTIPQHVNQGFTTYFAFQIHSASCCNPGDGLAFVVQNSSHTDESYGATGAGITARGVSEGGMGYAGIPNSLAVEFDTFANVWDPTSNHVAVQGCGTNTNGPVHKSGTFTIGDNNQVTSCLVASGLNSRIPHLGVTCANDTCADGSVHQVVIEYTPPADVEGSGTLMVWIDQPFVPHTHTPCPNNRIPGCPVAAVTSINISYTIDNTHSRGISLAGGTSAWVGFTGSQTNETQTEDILAWEFTPHAPAQIQQTIPNGGIEAHYSFGGNDTGVTYFPGFVNQNGCDGMQPSGVVCLMTVLATPTARNVFYQQRLVGTPFSNEQCVVYLGTGGNCVVYSITCQNSSNPHVNVTCPASLPNTCNNIGDPGCIIFETSFYTADPLTPSNADYIKTDPIGSNNWVSIFENYDPNIFDGRTTGTSGTPSDFVATLKISQHGP